MMNQRQNILAGRDTLLTTYTRILNIDTDALDRVGGINVAGSRRPWHQLINFSDEFLCPSITPAEIGTIILYAYVYGMDEVYDYIDSAAARIVDFKIDCESDRMITDYVERQETIFLQLQEFVRLVMSHITLSQAYLDKLLNDNFLLGFTINLSRSVMQLNLRTNENAYG